MAIAILVHGFNVWDGGKGSVGKLRTFFSSKQIPSVLVNYGWFGIGRTYVKNSKVAKKLAKACMTARIMEPQKPVIVVGHSNGCAIIHMAAKRYGAFFDKAVFINPALDSDKELPESIEALDVWYSPSDKPVKWSKWLPFHPWGEMGRTGYTGKPDPRVTNYDKENDFGVTSSSHSDVFEYSKIGYFGPIIVKTAIEGL